MLCQDKWFLPLHRCWYQNITNAKTLYIWLGSSWGRLHLATGPFLYTTEREMKNQCIYIYRQISYINGTLVGNKIVYHSLVVGASPVHDEENKSLTKKFWTFIKRGTRHIFWNWLTKWINKKWILQAWWRMQSGYNFAQKRTNWEPDSFARNYFRGLSHVVWQWVITVHKTSSPFGWDSCHGSWANGQEMGAGIYLHCMFHILLHQYEFVDLYIYVFITTNHDEHVWTLLQYNIENNCLTRGTSFHNMHSMDRSAIWSSESYMRWFYEFAQCNVH